MIHYASKNTKLPSPDADMHPHTRTPPHLIVPTKLLGLMRSVRYRLTLFLLGSPTLSSQERRRENICSGCVEMFLMSDKRACAQIDLFMGVLLIWLYCTMFQLECFVQLFDGIGQ
ncbi:hypothetical protein AVEN_80217-1 [Araneus ventricosus]|uniref:Uncharacterized protein n=1 Tax=Araneus ventricosus TaxID=182803 RepID=A0A4Y2LP63_ARAVE|nr:hypothetical protein AVEN_78015-1 [Araneus ventricosus]GBN16274.1 hypothetical protein AVEN_80217-1 [Araneus ventricosus]